MRRQALVAVVLGALAVGIVVAVVALRDTGTEAPEPRPSVATSRVLPGPREPSPPPRGALSIQGTVVDRDGNPVAGVEVSASRSMPGESLSSLPCGAETPDTVLSSTECAQGSWQVLIGLVEEGRGAAPVVTRTTSRGDGTFTLEGLPEGAVALWAVGAQGAVVAPRVEAGATQVRLTLGRGAPLSGRVVDETLRPLPGASVTLFLAEHSRYFETSTDTLGRFSLGPLPAGRYGFVASQPGLMPEYLVEVAPTNLGDVVLHPSRRIVGQVLTVEQRPVAGIEVRMEENGQSTRTGEDGRFVIEGVAPSDYTVTAHDPRQWGSQSVTLGEEQREVEVRIVVESLVHVRGTVQDPEGHPIPDAVVRVMGDGSEDFDAWTTTDAQGNFTLETLLLGPCTYVVEAAGFQDLKGEEGELSTPAPPPRTFVLEPAVLIQGLLVDEAGKPVPDVIVQLTASPPREEQHPPTEEEADTPGTYEDAPDDPALGGVEENRLASDANGRFQFELDRPGRFHLSTESEHFLKVQRSVDAPATDVRLVLSSGGRVVGRVVDGQGEPLPAAVLSVHASPDTLPVALPVRPDEEGRFQIEAVPPGRHVLLAAFDANLPHRETVPIEVFGTETVTVTVRLDAGLSVSGVVVDEANRPIPGATVTATPLTATPSHLRHLGAGFSTASSRGVADETGRFTVKHLLPGPCKLQVEADGHSLRGDPPVDAKPEESRPSVQVLAGAKDVRLVLQYDGGVRGRLLHEDGSPVVHFSVNEREYREADGTFVRDGFSGGSGWLTLSAPGLNHVVRLVDAPVGQLVDLGDIVMKAGRKVRGRVVDAVDSAPISGATVEATLSQAYVATVMDAETARLSSPPSPGTTVTRRDGTFEFDDVEGEQFTLKVDHPDHLTRLQPLGAGDTPLEVRLARGARLSGTVTDRRGKPVDGRIRALSLGPPQKTLDLIDVTEGEFEVSQLAPGTYALKAVMRHPETGEVFSFVPQVVTLASGEARTLAFREQVESTRVTLAMSPGPSGEQFLTTSCSVVPGDVPTPRTATELIVLNRTVAIPLDQAPTQPWGHFTMSLPAGRYTVFVVGIVVGSGDEMLHRQVLDVPREGALSLTVEPVWQPLAPGSPRD
ncbi:carboxypeptidase regulatory-like domain-containing protein [Myxococcus sp. K15C18031901]|uniref:carboxypeptidase regulatory-like domain-containing protein n=1 Tax=Myxococcus dinghuensis TaxID=2906761 RepID=UPI0020A7C29E|nr:carboxypeptidase regulatory-like domain-containing protein [Myxococcus dinghuensis]MCP3099319.1 carboxypeptidase regulatory-like domain-containing protein [Myxococcus dinghuensis]